MKIFKMINGLAGEEGWKDTGNEVVFIDAGTELMKKGFTEQEAGELLEKLYNAVSDEYGN